MTCLLGFGSVLDSLREANITHVARGRSLFCPQLSAIMSLTLFGWCEIERNTELLKTLTIEKFINHIGAALDQVLPSVLDQV